MNIVLTQTPPPPRFDSYRPVNLTGKIRPAAGFFPAAGRFFAFSAMARGSSRRIKRYAAPANSPYFVFSLSILSAMGRHRK